ncbi:hypothetical protein HPULCUR_009362 [Helicostylum pulchrum]|uniref:Uncharacterized protein n=1 Tax=Helicostylum pulchrum TaxID=562976 RepID=A0ABP9YAA3_9FUNG
MSLNLTQITLESVGNCLINTVSTSGGILSYATACIGADAVNASSVECYSISTTIDSTCDSILQAGINVDIGFECSNTCQVSLPATHFASATTTNSIPSSSSVSVETSDAPTHPGFSTNPPFQVATYTLGNTATNIYPTSFTIITFCIVFLFFIK